MLQRELSAYWIKILVQAYLISKAICVSYDCSMDNLKTCNQHVHSLNYDFVVDDFPKLFLNEV